MKPQHCHLIAYENMGKLKSEIRIITAQDITLKAKHCVTKLLKCKTCQQFYKRVIAGYSALAKEEYV
jgi:hypothetical protein